MNVNYLEQNFKDIFETINVDFLKENKGYFNGHKRVFFKIFRTFFSRT